MQRKAAGAHLPSPPPKPHDAIPPPNVLKLFANSLEPKQVTLIGGWREKPEMSQTTVFILGVVQNHTKVKRI